MRVIEVNEGDRLMAEEDLAQRIAGVAGAQRDRESAQGLADAKVASAIGKLTLGLNLAHLETGRVLGGRQGVGKRDPAGGDSRWGGAATGKGPGGRARC